MSHKLRVVECTLESLDGSFNRDVRLTEMKRPCGDAQIVTNSQLRPYPHLEDIDIVEAHDETIDVLLGVENGDILTSEERVLGTYFDDPVAVRCPLGWYIQGGRSTEYILATNAVVNFTQVSAISDVQDFLGIERVGMEPRHCKCVTEEEDHLATQTMKESVVQLDDLYLPDSPTMEEITAKFAEQLRLCCQMLPVPGAAVPEQTSRMGSLLESDGRSTQPWSCSYCADFRI